MGKRRPLWWAGWPGALGFGLGSLLLVAPAIFSGIVFLTLGDEGSGTDVVVEGPGVFPRILALLLVVVSVALPPLTVRWARKRWAGYLLLGICLSFACCLTGLILLGIL